MILPHPQPYFLREQKRLDLIVPTSNSPSAEGNVSVYETPSAYAENPGAPEDAILLKDSKPTGC